MKKILSVALFAYLCFLPALKAEDKISGSKPLPVPNRARSGQEMVNLTESRQASRIAELERRLANLERGIHYQDERYRNVERDISDLKRRR